MDAVDETRAFVVLLPSRLSRSWNLADGTSQHSAAKQMREITALAQAASEQGYALVQARSADVGDALMADVYDDDEPITMRDEDGSAYFVRNGAVVKAVCSICRSDKHLMSRHPGPCPLKDYGCPGMNAPNGDPITPHRDMCKFKYKGPRTPRPAGGNQRARAPGAFRRPQASLEAAEAQPPAETAAAAV